MNTTASWNTDCGTAVGQKSSTVEAHEARSAGCLQPYRWLCVPESLQATAGYGVFGEYCELEAAPSSRRGFGSGGIEPATQESAFLITP